MNILVTTSIYPPAIGGPSTHISGLVREMRLRGHRVTVVTLREEGTEPYPDVYCVRESFAPFRIARVTWIITRLGKSHDVIYVQGLWIEAAIANFWLRKPLVRKIVGDWAWERTFARGWVSDSFDDFQRRSHSWPIALCKFLRSSMTRRCDRVIVPSEYLKRCVLGWGVSTEQVSVIANAILPNSNKRGNVAPQQLSGRVVAVGRLVKWKGFEDIITALALLPDLELVIVGDGPERKRLEEHATSKNLRSRVQFTGRLTHDRVLEELAHAGAFVLNSSYEGFPHVLLEAFRSETPVVAADAGGVNEIIRHEENGLLVRQGDVAGIREALLRIFQEPDLAVRLRQSGKKTLEEYSFSKMVEHIENSLADAVRFHSN